MTAEHPQRNDRSEYEAIIVFSRTGKVVSANPVARRITGYGSRLAGQSLSALVHPDDRRRFNQAVKPVRAGEKRRCELTFNLHDSKGKRVGVRAVVSQQGKEFRLNFVVLPSSERTAANALGQLVDDHGLAAFSMTEDGRIDYASRSFLSLSGYSSVKSLPALTGLIASTKAYQTFMRKLREEGQLTGESASLITRKGEEIAVKLSLVGNPAGDPSRRYYGTLSAGHEGVRYESLVAKVLDSAKDQILALDAEKRYIVFNQAHANLMRTLTGRDIRVGDKLLESIPRELIPLARKELKRAFASDRYHAEIALPNKMILRTSSYVIRDDRDRISGIAIFAEDISERKKTELKLKALNEELTFQNWQLAAREEELRMAMDQLSERNFELDQLMYKTSHDLRSPLSSILGLVNLANLDPNPANLGQYLKKIEGRIKKLDEFISSMVNYARVNRGEITVGELDLERMVKAAIHELEYLDNFQAVKTSVVVNNGHVPFRNDHFLMNIIVGNVISNAYKYYNPEVDSYLRITIDIRDTQATLEFADNGIGIRKEHQDKIFDMFYRATDRSQGSGLGMYIVRQAIEKVEGTISVKSVYGSGTSIRITVPNL
ncbi:MAG TPA: ATP-binding protein [Cyclobacteriaceae bacterium]